MNSIDYLCQKYDIAVFRVGDSCFANTSPTDEQDKWFISTLAAEARFDTSVEVPLADSEDSAKALAVKIYNLHNIDS